jgi:hypothetical protein
MTKSSCLVYLVSFVVRIFLFTYPRQEIQHDGNFTACPQDCCAYLPHDLNF